MGGSDTNNTGIDPDFDPSFSHLAMSTAPNTDTPAFWPDQDASLPSQAAPSNFGTAQPPDFTDPLAAQINAHPQAVDYAHPQAVDYAQYHHDPASQAYWVPDSGSAQPGPSSGPAATGMPYVCDVEGCTREFERQCDLDKHQNNHYRPRICDICGAGFAENKDLFRHMWTHHPDEARDRGVPREDDECPVCGYSGRRDNVKRHRDTHNHY
jgi:hypothetical protein